MATKLGGDGAGLLDKQLKHLIGMETVGKESPINRKSDRKKTFYSLKDNLMRFYFCFLFGNEGRIGRVGEDAFYESAIEPALATFIALRFEGIATQYLERRARLGALPGVEDIGTYWYDGRARRESGQFDCVARMEDGYRFYEVKHYARPMRLEECQAEETQVLRAVGLPAARVGFICSGGFDFESDDYELITGEDVYELPRERPA